MGTERLLRLHPRQRWFNLSDLAVEETLDYSCAMSQFIEIDLGREPVPAGTTICTFWHLLETHQIGQQLFARIGVHLAAHGLQVSRGTIVDVPHHCHLQFHEESADEAGSRSASYRQGQPVVVRDEDLYWGGQAAGYHLYTKLLLASIGQVSK